VSWCTVSNVTVQGLEGQLLLLRLACSANSHVRNVVLRRPHGSSLWPPFDMTLAGDDSDDANGAFITHVNAAARQLGLRTGDQVCLSWIDCINWQKLV